METAPVNLSSSSPTSESSLFTAFNKVPSTKSAGKWHVDKRREEGSETCSPPVPRLVMFWVYIAGLEGF